jgi:DNA polymerase-3 subunit alpha
MADRPFVHLHCHTDYSLLDGACEIGQLMRLAEEQGMPAVAMTDHGNMFGAYDFWKTATDAGVKPIIGTEAYLAPPGATRFDKTRVRLGSGGEDDISGAGAYTHITLLAENREGMHNLFRLSSLASIEGYYFKPRMDPSSGCIVSNG